MLFYDVSSSEPAELRCIADSELAAKSAVNLERSLHSSIRVEQNLTGLLSCHGEASDFEKLL